jgi:hypothetical protein
MPQLYLSADNASSVRRCNQSRRTRQVITISGLDPLTGGLASFTGIVEAVEADHQRKGEAFLGYDDARGARGLNGPEPCAEECSLLHLYAEP